MGLRFGSTVINCTDIDLMTRFWSAALGFEPTSTDPDDDFRRLRGPHVHVSLQVAETPVTGRDQMHLDLYTEDKAAEVERLVGLGATWVRSSDDPEDDWDVLLDPEGNEFCICQHTLAEM
jgi:catechol 2,3-dioxygenase-like lactoylglutathione lyase family enzyme